MKSSLLNKNSGYRQIKEIIKRDGRSVYFDANKILQAIMKSFDAVGEIRSESVKNLLMKLHLILFIKYQISLKLSKFRI